MLLLINWCCFLSASFQDSQFLVFINRILAFVMALIVITVRKQPVHTAPLYKYSFSSFSNIMSSWCQYEALKFVSFPTQVRIWMVHEAYFFWLYYRKVCCSYLIDQQKSQVITSKLELTILELLEVDGFLHLS